jgi:CheY-like chemotaxis protein
MLDSSRINLKTAKVLVADDNENARNIIQDMLRAFGASDIVTARDGCEAKALLTRQQFDLLITDGTMPECDGYELVRWLRNRPSDEERITPAIIISAHTRESQVAAGRDCGANYIIAKPISPQTLLERIYYITEEARSFIVGETYAGPDRRWKHQGPPASVDGRRKGDLSVDIGIAINGNLSENELDSLVKPQKVTP